MHGRGFCNYLSALALAILLVVSAPASAAGETLKEAWVAALAADHNLKASRDNSAAAAKQLAAAKAARLPILGMGAGYAAVAELPTLNADLMNETFQIPMGQRNSAVYNTTATLPIYTGGRVERGIASASSSLEAAKLGEAVSEENLKLRVAEAYVNVLRASQWVRVAESHQKALEAHSSDVNNLVQQGMAARNAQLSSEVAVLDARQQVLQANNSLDLARAAYNRLLGRGLDEPVVLDEVSLQSTDDALQVLTERALTQRAELKAMDRQVDALRDQAIAVRRETVPQVGISGGYDYQQNRYQVHEGQWSISLGVKWNVFDGGASRDRGSAVDFQAEALSEQRNELASLIALQVRQSWLDLQTTRKRKDVTQSAINHAEENVRVVRDRYVNGLAPYTEVLDAESQRVNSENNHANALYDEVVAGFRLKHAIGEL